MCCDPVEYSKDEIVDGECPECGEPTIDGDAEEICNYSRTECEVCGWSPCDGSC